MPRGTAGDRYWAEDGIDAQHPSGGYPFGHPSGGSTSFSVSNFEKHTELELLVSPVGRLTEPMGGGPGGMNPPPEGVWLFEVEWEFGNTQHERWWYTDGSSWGGDPWEFVHHEDYIEVTVTGTWMSGGAEPTWFLDQAKLWRRTPSVFMYAIDTAEEGKDDYSPVRSRGSWCRAAGMSSLGRWR